MLFCVVGRLENSGWEHAVILKMLNVRDVEKVMRQAYDMRRSNEKSQSTEHSFEQMWANVTSDRLGALTDIYRSDIELLGYPAHPLQQHQYT